MASPAISDPRYPIGKFTLPAAFEPELLPSSIAELAAMPENLRAAVDGLSRVQIDTPYREGGWTVRQLVHHIADSHLNAYSRTKMALTEEWPTIYAYDESRWAELADAKTLPVEISLDLLEPLHRRWVALFASLAESDWQRGYIHPENGRNTLAKVAALYAWHSRHHVAHITELRKSRGWR
jgi:DinB superfamily